MGGERADILKTNEITIDAQFENEVEHSRSKCFLDACTHRECLKKKTCLIFILRKLDAAAVKLWTALWPGPLQQQRNELFG